MRNEMWNEMKWNDRQYIKAVKPAPTNPLPITSTDSLHHECAKTARVCTDVCDVVAAWHKEIFALVFTEKVVYQFWDTYTKAIYYRVNPSKWDVEQTRLSTAPAGNM